MLRLVGNDNTTHHNYCRSYLNEEFNLRGLCHLSFSLCLVSLLDPQNGLFLPLSMNCDETGSKMYHLSLYSHWWLQSALNARTVLYLHLYFSFSLLLSPLLCVCFCFLFVSHHTCHALRGSLHPLRPYRSDQQIWIGLFSASVCSLSFSLKVSQFSVLQVHY